MLLLTASCCTAALQSGGNLVAFTVGWLFASVFLLAIDTTKPKLLARMQTAGRLMLTLLLFEIIALILQDKTSSTMTSGDVNTGSTIRCAAHCAICLRSQSAAPAAPSNRHQSPVAHARYHALYMPMPCPLFAGTGSSRACSSPTSCGRRWVWPNEAAATT